MESLICHLAKERRAPFPCDNSLKLPVILDDFPCKTGELMVPTLSIPYSHIVRALVEAIIS